MTNTTTLTMDQANQVTDLVNELDALHEIADMDGEALDEHVTELSNTIANEVLSSVMTEDDLPDTLSNGLREAASIALTHVLDAVRVRTGEVKGKLAALGVAVVDQDAAQRADQNAADAATTVDEPQGHDGTGAVDLPAASEPETVTDTSATTAA